MKKPSKNDNLDDKVAKAEITMSAFMAEHNVPFLQADHLIECCKLMFPDSAIAQGMSFKRNKAAYVMQQGIAHYERLTIVDICREQKFSIIIDESTDVSTAEVLAVVVRFLDEKRAKVVDTLLDLVEVGDGTSAGLFTAVKKLLANNEIPISNVVGFAADNCSTMMGTEAGFQALLKKEIPSVFVLGCVCHSFALCANAASNRLPSWLEAFIKSVCFYFSRSSKRSHQFQLIQDVVQVEKHKVLKLCETRWLSRQAVIERILEQWDALQLFFQTEAPVDKVDGASQILHTMNTPGTKHMLAFVGYVLGKVNNMNIEFQSEYYRLHKLYSSVTSEYRSILRMFIKDDVLREVPLADIDPADTRMHKKLSCIQLGGRCEGQLMLQPLGEKEAQFRTDAVAFLKELCLQIRNRFPLSDKSVVAHMQLLDPCKALDENKPSIIPLAMNFASIVPNSKLDRLSDQWNDLSLYAKQFENLIQKEPAVFWLALKQVTDGNEKPKFDILTDLMCTLLTLPHSSACVERVFSQVNIVKTKQTNRLLCQTVSNRILAKQAVSKHSCCYTWVPGSRLVEDVREGRCRKRYVTSVQLKEGITSHALDEADVVDIDVGNLHLFQ